MAWIHLLLSTHTSAPYMFWRGTTLRFTVNSNFPKIKLLLRQHVYEAKGPKSASTHSYLKRTPKAKLYAYIFLIRAKISLFNSKSTKSTIRTTTKSNSFKFYHCNLLILSFFFLSASSFPFTVSFSRTSSTILLNKAEVHRCPGSLVVPHSLTHDPKCSQFILSLPSKRGLCIHCNTCIKSLWTNDWDLNDTQKMNDLFNVKNSQWLKNNHGRYKFTPRA